MNIHFAYLLGLIIGNGKIQRGNTETTVAIEFPHKNFRVDNTDIMLHMQASLNEIRNFLEPTLSSSIRTAQRNSVTTMSFTKPNQDYLITEINRYLRNYSSHENMRIPRDVFDESRETRLAVMQGISDSTAYVRRSNYFFKPYRHRVYVEIPHNWYLVIDIANLLKSLDIPIQTIDFAHPNLRDGNMVKYNQGKINFWKKEHQIKIWAQEYLPVGFKVSHKQRALELFAQEQMQHSTQSEIINLHKFYWENAPRSKTRADHPAVDDNSIPSKIRGRQMSGWQQIANELGYNERS